MKFKSVLVLLFCAFGISLFAYTEKCSACNGTGRIDNPDYDRKKIGSMKSFHCKQCRGIGNLTQVLNGLFGVSLYQKMPVRLLSKNSDGDWEMKFSRYVPFRNFSNVKAELTYDDQKICNITAEWQAPDSSSAQQEMKSIESFFRKKYGDKLKFHIAQPQKEKAQSRSSGGRTYTVGGFNMQAVLSQLPPQSSTSRDYYYDPKKIRSMMIFSDLDSQITLTCDLNNKIHISCHSVELLRKK